MPTSEWPARLPDPRSLHSLREELLTRGLRAVRGEQPGVRPVIERSWRRCVADAVPTARPDLPHAELSTMTVALRDAAAPVVERMSEHLGDLRVGMYVSNDRGQILLREVGEAQHRRLLDRACAAEGFDFSEVSVGTNGMGTAIVERRPVLVHGAEHFSDLLEDVTCAATPIFEPFTRRLLGTFSLACATKDASPLLYGLTTDVGRQIESNLTTMLGAREQGLIRAYLMAENTSREPVLVLTDRTVFANTAGVPHLDSGSHAALWDLLVQQGPSSGTHPLRLPLAGSWYDALVEPVEGTRGSQPAWCIRLLPRQGLVVGDLEPRPAAPARSVPALAAAPPLLTVGHDAAVVEPPVAGPAVAGVDTRRTLALEGGPGSGKLHEALALLAGLDPLVVDVSGVRPDDVGEWSSTALGALTNGRPVVLRHLQDLHPRDVNRVLALATAASAAPTSVTLLMTVDAEHAPDYVTRLVERIAPVVRLAGLAEEPQRVADLVPELLEQLAPAGRPPRLSSEALQCLMRWSWPGNVEELRSVLHDLCVDFEGRLVRQADLPARLQRAPQRRAASLMESAEREAIVTALQQAEGNRSRAAELLGIGRTTLYRKLQQLRIDA
jgi:sigma-54 dependent transcriptional regulator, acetoin dehydrogenase operon transcriptional activator AcoR